MDRDDVEIIERAPLHSGYTKVERWTLRHRLFAGGWGKTITREVIDRGHAAAVLPYDAAHDRVVLIEQFRAGAYGAGLPPWNVEIVAGIIEPGESPEAVVRREALEEAGVAVTDLVPMFRYLASPGILTETVAAYCGRADSEGVGGVFGLDHEGEDIRAFTATLDEAMAMIADGRIVNVTTIVALQWLALNRPKLRRKWAASRRRTPR